MSARDFETGSGSPGDRRALGGVGGHVGAPHEIVAPGEGWARVVRAGERLRIIDLEGKQAVDFLCYDAANPEERYNAADTMKYAGTIFLTAGHGIYSDMGRRMFTIVGDTCGRHDTIGGCCSAESNLLRYGERGSANCRDTFLRALAPFGLGKKDIVTNLNFFMNVPVERDGRMALAEGFSKPGDYVELEAGMDVLAVISNCAQTRNPVNGFNPTPIRVIVSAPRPRA
jgi:uncharacterized protein